MSINFDVKSCIHGTAAFTAEIECIENENRDRKLRLAVIWALENGVDLSGVDLSGVDLSGVDLSGVDLSYANLSGADLSDANLRGANLRNANLRGANLRNANLRNANLSCANLSGANLRGANLSRADLSHANLSGANLRGAKLSGACLFRADILCLGDMGFIKTLQIGKWEVAYTHDTLQIGCQTHTIEKWKNWETSRKWISEMDSDALEWAKTHLNIILKLVEISPAKSTLCDNT